MVQYENSSAGKTAKAGYGTKSQEVKKTNFAPAVTQKNAKDASKTGGWGQYKNEGYFKSLHHC